MRGLLFSLAFLTLIAVSAGFWLTWRWGADRLTIRRQANALLHAKSGLRQIEKYAFSDEYSRNLATVTLYEINEALTERKSLDQGRD